MSQTQKYLIDFSAKIFPITREGKVLVGQNGWDNYPEFDSLISKNNALDLRLKLQEKRKLGRNNFIVLHFEKGVEIFENIEIIGDPINFLQDYYKMHLEYIDTDKL